MHLHTTSCFFLPHAHYMWLDVFSRALDRRGVVEPTGAGKWPIPAALKAHCLDLIGRKIQRGAFVMRRD